MSHKEKFQKNLVFLAVRVLHSMGGDQGLREQKGNKDHRRHPDLRRPRQRGRMGRTRAVSARRRRLALRGCGSSARLFCKGRSALGKSSLRLGLYEKGRIFVVEEQNGIYARDLRRCPHRPFPRL